MRIATGVAMLAASLAGLPALAADAPLAKPLAEFDRLAAQLKSGGVVGEPVQMGDVTVIPFSRVQFTLASGGAMAVFGGGMGAKSVPMGVLILDKDEVRAESFAPVDDKSPSVLRDLMQAVLDRRVVIMGNGLNLGQTTGTAQDLAPLMASMMGQTTIMGNSVNLGSMTTPRGPSAVEVDRLLSARRWAEAYTMSDWLATRDPLGAEGLRARGTFRLKAPKESGGDVAKAVEDLQGAADRQPSADAFSRLGEAWRKHGDKAKAAAAYRKALALEPKHAEATKGLAALK